MIVQRLAAHRKTVGIKSQGETIRLSKSLGKQRSHLHSLRQVIP